ncbi:MAG: DUF2946 family protein [Rhizomicrobium sp.]
MTRVHRPRAKVRAAPRGSLSRALVFLTLLAFALQGFVTQTHIHLPSSGGPALADLFDGKAAPSPGQDKSPSKNDPANCPLCQSFASAGHFVTPAAAATLLPFLSISVIAVAVQTTHAVPAVTHIWRGRAPPLG